VWWAILLVAPKGDHAHGWFELGPGALEEPVLEPAGLVGGVGDDQNLVGGKLPQRVASGDQRVAVTDFAASGDARPVEFIQRGIEAPASLHRGGIDVTEGVPESGFLDRWRSDHHLRCLDIPEVSAQILDQLWSSNIVGGDDEDAGVWLEGRSALSLSLPLHRCPSTHNFAAAKLDWA
jgi:hypothetical protein